MRKLSGIALTAVFVLGILSVLIPVMPVSAATWDPSLGWDFQCHSYTHPYLTKLTDAQIRAELQAVNDAFTAHGYAVPTQHAYPYGDYDARVESIVAEYRKSGRMVWGFYMEYPITNWYELKAAQLKPTTSWNRIVGWVNDCIAKKALLHIFTHDVSANPSQYGCTPEKLAQVLDYLVEKQNAGLLTVVTMAEAYDYWSTATQGKAMVVVSFDDGNDSDYYVVWPMFKARGIKGTSYIYPQAMDEGWSDCLSWQMIAEMRSGAPPPPPGVMHVSDITMSYTKSGSSYTAKATVTVVDDGNAAVSGATVYGTWSGAWTGDVNGVTDATGKVTLSSGKVRGGGTFTFTVTNIVKTDWTYDPSKNVETSDTITCP